MLFESLEFDNHLKKSTFLNLDLGYDNSAKVSKKFTPLDNCTDPNDVKY